MNLNGFSISLSAAVAVLFSFFCFFLLLFLFFELHGAEERGRAAGGEDGYRDGKAQQRVMGAGLLRSVRALGPTAFCSVEGAGAAPGVCGVRGDHMQGVLGGTPRSRPTRPGLGAGGRGRAAGRSGDPAAAICRAQRPLLLAQPPCQARIKNRVMLQQGKEGPGGTGAALCSPIFIETDLCT